LVEILAFLNCSPKVTVLEQGKHLSFVNVIPPLHEEFLHGSADLRRDGRLLQRMKHGFRRNDMGDTSPLSRRHLNGRDWLRIPLIAAGFCRAREQ
jgi:hypothetical protein